MIARPVPASPKNPWIVSLPGQIAHAFTGAVANIAEHEKIAECRAGKTCKVGRFTGPQTFDEAAGGSCSRVRSVTRLLHTVGKRRINGDTAVDREVKEALRQIGIAFGKCRTDFTFGDVAVEYPIKRLITDLYRIGRRGQTGVGAQPAARKDKCSRGKQNCSGNCYGRMTEKTAELRPRHNEAMRVICGFLTTGHRVSGNAGNRSGRPLWCCP